MPTASKLLLPALMLACSLSLAGCKSSDEKAEDYYQSGLTLLKAGDEERAMVEFRNVFNYNGFHKEARQSYADLLLKRGQVSEAYAQYLRLIEQYPDTPDVRIVLAETAMGLGNWNEVERHGREAIRLAPENPRAQAIGVALDYRDAVVARDEAKRTEVAARAEELLKTQPESIVLRRVTIDRKITGPDPQAARADVDAALAHDPKSLEFNAMKLRLLGQSSDVAGVGAQLKTMVEYYPDNEELKSSLIKWFMAQKDFDGAEAFLRKEAGAETGNTQGHLSLVQFLNATRGRDAGRAELTRLIAANKDTANADLYGSFLATMEFEDGQQEAGLKMIEEILAKAQPSDQTRNIMGMQAKMLEKMGQHDKAVAIVESVLKEDATNVDALKLRGAWSISADNPGQAIIDLRAAASQAPRDPQIMTLMAAAFERDGSPDLAGEQLAKAVEVSGSGPEESLRYADFLRKQGRAQVAETVLTDARRVSPAHPAVLAALAEIQISESKWQEVKEIANVLRQLGQPQTIKAAEQMEAAILLGQDKVDEGLTLLEQQASATDAGTRPIVMVVQTQLRSGKIAEARSYLDEALAKKPDDPTLLLLSANVDAMQGNREAAEKGFRNLIAKYPKTDVPVRALYKLLLDEGREADAAAVLDAGLAALPDNTPLLLIKGGEREAAQDFEGAIKVYEHLYSLDTSNTIAANNLASMLSSHRDDKESLDRAANIARRLRSSDAPALQDTYGWIEYRRGNVADALPYLETGAKGLPGDPLAQFHLGMAYADLERKDEAVAQLKLALELGKGKNLPQMAQAQARLDQLGAAQ